MRGLRALPPAAPIMLTHHKDRRDTPPSSSHHSIRYDKFLDVLKAQTAAAVHSKFAFIAGNSVDNEIGRSVTNDLYLVVISVAIFVLVAVLGMSRCGLGAAVGCRVGVGREAQTGAERRARGNGEGIADGDGSLGQATGSAGKTHNQTPEYLHRACHSIALVATTHCTCLRLSSTRRTQSVATRSSLALLGVVSGVLAMVAGYGLSMLFGCPFTTLAQVRARVRVRARVAAGGEVPQAALVRGLPWVVLLLQHTQ